LYAYSVKRASRAVPSGFWLGDEMKNLGPLQFGGPLKKFFQKPKNFSGKYWGGGEAPKFFSNTRFT
jgi:hypothetical protein